MFKRKQWIAVVRENQWVVAKVARRKQKLDILKLSEIHIRPDSEVSRETNQGFVGENEPFSEEDDLKKGSLSGGKKTDLIKAWLRKNGVPLNRLRLAVSCPGVITRMITLPLMPVKDLDKLLTEQVDQYFTLSISDYVVDYRVIDQFTEQGEPRQRVLLAALPRYHWETFWSEWKEIGFVPKVVDLAADGLVRLYSRLALTGLQQRNPDDPEAPPDLAIVELSADRVELIILEKGNFFLHSDLEAALKGLDPLRASLRSIVQGGVPEQQEEAEVPDERKEKLLSLAKADVEMALRNVLESLAEFLGFFAARHFGKSVDRIYITGDYADLPALREVFQANLEIYTQVGFPNVWYPGFSKRARAFQKDGIKYGSLYGLAMRRAK